MVHCICIEEGQKITVCYRTFCKGEIVVGVNCLQKHKDMKSFSLFWKSTLRDKFLNPYTNEKIFKQKFF